MGAGCLEDGGERFAMEKYVIHPKFQLNIYGHDIALIKVKGEIKFNDQVEAVSYSSQDFPEHADAVLAGWNRYDVSISVSRFSKFKKGKN